MNMNTQMQLTAESREYILKVLSGRNQMLKEEHKKLHDLSKQIEAELAAMTIVVKELGVEEA